ncbi:hypothetical protein MMCCUG48898_3817 [Mycobacteroides abscessus subsp. massiliense CCUG 48898 = JCM 15300]|nr:hypothetical protein MMCCUG48898_3817 [Mycobacteroides abscessus subsp. massiliense CCUG 48898 = JCM 15300]BAP98571.1 hypothetical protein MMASJCM_3795 [Mycobacteroides abscessus subsp. massiliense CCUG 48898 = JCM 15300]
MPGGGSTGGYPELVGVGYGGNSGCPGSGGGGPAGGCVM